MPTFKEYMENNRIKYSTIFVDININSKSLTDIYGIENFTNITSLDLNYNLIIDIEPLKYLKNLEGLYMYKNNIEDISCLKNLKNLQYLFVGANNITDITPLRYSNIEELSLNDNYINDIEPIYYMNKLKKLWISKKAFKNKFLENINKEFFADNELKDLKTCIKIERRKRLISIL